MITRGTATFTCCGIYWNEVCHYVRSFSVRLDKIRPSGLNLSGIDRFTVCLSKYCGTAPSFWYIDSIGTLRSSYVGSSGRRNFRFFTGAALGNCCFSSSATSRILSLPLECAKSMYGAKLGVPDLYVYASLLYEFTRLAYCFSNAESVIPAIPLLNVTVFCILSGTVNDCA